jgi:hypothetical protein
MPIYQPTPGVRSHAVMLPLSQVSPTTVSSPAILLPNIPQATALAQAIGGGLTATWTVPAVDGAHSAATGFNLRFSPSGANTWTVVSNVASPCPLVGLTAGAAYDVQVQSANAAGVSGWSATSTLSTAAAPSGSSVPNAPSINSVAPPADGTNSVLTVIWTPPAADSSHPAAAGYNLRYSPSGAGTWTTVSGVASPYKISGLSGAAAIDVEVQATNASGNPGAWSSVTTGSTWGATVTGGNLAFATTQVHGTGVAPGGGANCIATPAPTGVTGAAFAWSASSSTVPTTGLVAGSADGQTNGWGQYFNAPATAGTYYLWMLAQGAGNVTIGALVSPAITVT